MRRKNMTGVMGRMDIVKVDWGISLGHLEDIVQSDALHDIQKCVQPCDGLYSYFSFGYRGSDEARRGFNQIVTLFYTSWGGVRSVASGRQVRQVCKTSVHALHAALVHVIGCAWAQTEKAGLRRYEYRGYHRPTRSLAFLPISS